MSNFRVGIKVVCINDSGFLKSYGEVSPVKGEIYTIRAIDEDGDGIYLVEITNIPRMYSDGYGEFCFFDWRFRPVAEKPTAMDVIRSIVLDPSKPIPADPREPVITPVPEYEQGARL